MEISNIHHQAMNTSHSLEEVLGCGANPDQQQEKKLRPLPEQALKCPRCESTNTKFCYYNNYSLSQPRYFCKGCRRYWTQGGSLRNVPVGGGCRKNKRSSSSSSSYKKTQDQAPTTHPNLMLPTISTPPLSYDPSDLTLAFARLQRQTTGRQIGLDNDHDNFLFGNPNPNPIPTPGFLDILKGGFFDTTNTGGFHNLYYGLGLNGSVDEVECGGGVGGEGPLVPFGNLAGAAAAAAIKQESCKSMDHGENKVVMGLHWQAGGDGNMVVESGRDYWGGIGSSWHGLVNSSLM